MNLVEYLRGLEAKATPGPWVVTPNGDAIYRGDKQDGGPCVVVAPAGRVMGDPERLVADLTLIEEGHNALPALLRLVRAQEAMLRVYRDGDTRGAREVVAEYEAARKACGEATP